LSMRSQSELKHPPFSISPIPPLPIHPFPFMELSESPAKQTPRNKICCLFPVRQQLASPFLRYLTHPKAQHCSYPIHPPRPRLPQFTPPPFEGKCDASRMLRREEFSCILQRGIPLVLTSPPFWVFSELSERCF